MVAEFESDLIRARTREGMAVARVRGKLKGRKPKLSPAQERHLVALHRAGDHSVSELVELFGIGRATVYRALDRHPVTTSTVVTLPRVDDEPTSCPGPRSSTRLDPRRTATPAPTSSLPRSATNSTSTPCAT